MKIKNVKCTRLWLHLRIRSDFNLRFYGSYLIINYICSGENPSGLSPPRFSHQLRSRFILLSPTEVSCRDRLLTLRHASFKPGEARSALRQEGKSIQMLHGWREGDSEMVGSIRTFTTIPHSDVGDRTVDSLLEIYSIDIRTAVFLHVHWKLLFLLLRRSREMFWTNIYPFVDRKLLFCWPKTIFLLTNFYVSVYQKTRNYLKYKNFRDG